MLETFFSAMMGCFKMPPLAQYANYTHKLQNDSLDNCGITAHALFLVAPICPLWGPRCALNRQ